MKQKISAIAAIYFAIIFLAACSKPSSPLALHVPADASAVFIIDGKTLADKITSSGLTIDSLAGIFDNPLEETDLTWNDIQSAGVRLDKPFYAFFKEQNSMQEGLVKSSAFITEVEDEKKLEAFFKKKKASKEVLSLGDYKYIALDDDFVAGWTKDVFIVSQVTGGNNAPGNYGTGQGTLSQQQLTTLFSQKKSASFADAPGFEEMVAKTGDIHFYTNSKAGLSSEKIPAAETLQSLLKDTYTEGVINFDNGKITVVPVTHYGKTFADMLSKYPPQQIDKDMLGNYPDTLTGFMLASFNPQILTDVLKHTGFSTMADGFAGNLGFTSQDVVGAFSGDIALMLSLNKTETALQGAGRNMSYLLNFKIGNKALFDKVLNGLLNKQILTKQGDEYRIGMEGGHNFVIETGNNSLLFASSDALIKAYQSAGSKATIPAGIEKQAGDKSMVLYVDINHLFSDIHPAETATGMYKPDSIQTVGFTGLAKETFKDFLATVDKSDGKTAKADLTLNLVNSNENSLAVIAKFIAAMKAEDQKREQYRHSMIQGKDSAAEENEND